MHPKPLTLGVTGGVAVHGPVTSLTPVPTRQQPRHVCSSSSNVPRHAVLGPGPGRGADTRAPRQGWHVARRGGPAPPPH